MLKCLIKKIVKLNTIDMVLVQFLSELYTGEAG
jgi:hypothetical protein